MPRETTNATVPLSDPRFDELGAPVEVRRHPKARRLTLRVSRTRRAVVVTLPTQCDLVEAGSFVHRHIDWVRERLGNIPEPVPFQNKICMPLRGEVHRVVFLGEKTTPPVTRVEHLSPTGTDVGASYPEIHVGGCHEFAPRRMRDWLFSEAKSDLDACVVFHAKRLGVRAKRLAIRDQTSRWGSCSSNGSLSFSWRLIMAPPFVLEYVAAHEVAHLREMNHGPNFWALVQQTMPRMEEAKTWLQVYGMDLHRYGVDSVA
ncbi:MAG: SprT family zinc-dependent metalloprotease [Pseudomonadota bacterium]